MEAMNKVELRTLSRTAEAARELYSAWQLARRVANDENKDADDQNAAMRNIGFKRQELLKTAREE